MFIVEMAHCERGPDTRETWSCSGAAWTQLLSLAEHFGWHPQGTVPDAMNADAGKYMSYFKPTYEPEDWLNCKVVSAHDARAMAAALLRAADTLDTGKVVVLRRTAPTLLQDDMGIAETQRVNADPVSLLRDFARFAHGGAFVFAWDD